MYMGDGRVGAADDLGLLPVCSFHASQAFDFGSDIAARGVSFWDKGRAKSLRQRMRLEPHANTSFSSYISPSQLVYAR